MLFGHSHSTLFHVRIAPTPVGKVTSFPSQHTPGRNIGLRFRRLHGAAEIRIWRSGPWDLIVPTCSDGHTLKPHADLWSRETTFGSDGPPRRQLQLPYHPCQTHRSQPRSARRPSRQPGGQISASADRVWRGYTPHKISENGGRIHGTSSYRFAPMGPNLQTHVY